MKISDIDKNFSVSSDIPMEDTEFYNVKEMPFCLFGLMYDTKFRRMPESVAKEINNGVYALHANTSGGRIRFKTNSPYIALIVKMPAAESFPHMPKTGASSFDVYCDGVFRGIFISPADMKDGYSGICHVGDGTMKEYTINFPLYNDVEHNIFIMDYDHNAPTVEHLINTHAKFFKHYRSLQPETPVIIASAPNIKFCGKDWEKRRDIVRATYENAIASNDKNVYFIDGETLWGENWDSCSVDRTHPNDIGHFEMSVKMADVIMKLI